MGWGVEGQLGGRWGRGQGLDVCIMNGVVGFDHCVRVRRGLDGLVCHVRVIR